jgi:hypothetical protein
VASLREIVVRIVGKHDEFDKAITSSKKKVDNFSKAAIKIGKTAQKAGKQLSLYLTAPIVALGVAAVKAFGDQAAAEAKLNAAIRATGKETEISTERLKAYASELQKVTLFGDEATIQALAMLQSFADLDEKGLMQVIPQVQNLAAALNVDLNTAATLVGKTLGSETNALSRYGIVLDASADKSEKLAEVTSQLENKFGGMAEEVAQAGVGSIVQLKNTLGDLMEDIGQLMIPTINKIVARIREWAEWFRNLDDGTKRTIITVAGIVAAVGPVLLIVGKLIVVMGSLAKAFAIVNAALAVPPLGLIVAIAAAAVGIGCSTPFRIDSSYCCRRCWDRVTNK